MAKERLACVVIERPHNASQTRVNALMTATAETTARLS
jgi:hypothetical protein